MVGQDLFDLSMAELGGYANAVKPDRLLKFLNEGKDEIWAMLKELKKDYFLQSSQNSDNTADNYFANLATATREYSLPTDFRTMRYVEVTGPSGYEGVKFSEREISSPQFQETRKAANQQTGSLSQYSEYYYSIVGKGTFMLAGYPEVVFVLKLWYIRWIKDFDTADTIDEILNPYSKKIALFAAKMAILSLQDPGKTEEWRREWRESALMIENTAAVRQESDPVFVIDFMG